MSCTSHCPLRSTVLAIAFGVLFSAGLALAPTSFAEDTPTKSETPAKPVKPVKKAPFDRALYASLLEAHTKSVADVVGTRVDYRALGRSEDWKRLVAQIRSARPSTLDRDGKLAFWINAYNILTIDLVLQHYPLDSIRDIGSFFSPVWNVEVATIEGRTLSLGEIEHEILRKMGEPRIHAAIVCASTSCPPLARTPFTPARLGADLDAAMRQWLASSEKGVSIDRTRNQVSVSAIFDWFEEDFETGGGVLATIARYAPTADAAWLQNEGRQARIQFFDYDWTLNDFTR
ncbi:MAG: DUF547 domain-containing protein [Myxococcota bacterium]